jgi:hypothetical protein
MAQSILSVPSETVDSRPAIYLSIVMPNEFDPYRDALVMETLTVWPDEYDGLDESQRSYIEQRLHAEPQRAADLKYERQHSGFTRIITVTPADIERIK